MGSIGGMLGTSGGAGGTGFSGPNEANIERPVSLEEAKKAQEQANQTVGGQQKLLEALQSQNALGEQSNLMDKLRLAGGVNTQIRNIQGIEGAAGQYENIAQGRGPNPAQAMLNQATGANIANQAALMAGQRGAGANVGMMARQAAQQGGALQQQAVGQGATMQANQSLNALAGVVNARQAAGAMGGQQVAAQQAMANQLAGQQIGATQSAAQGALANVGQQQQAINAANQAAVGMQGNINNANAGMANTRMGNQAGVVGGVMNAGAGALSAALAHGGAVHQYADGGGVGPGDFLLGWKNSGEGQQRAPEEQSPFAMAQGKENEALQKGVGAFGKPIGKAIKGKSSDNSQAMAGEATPMQSDTMMASDGGKVAAKAPSQKAEKSGDSYDNDKVPAMLSEGEFVIPRSIMSSSDPSGNAAKFIQNHLSKKKYGDASANQGKQYAEGGFERSDSNVSSEQPQQMASEEDPLKDPNIITDTEPYKAGKVPQQQAAPVQQQAAPEGAPSVSEEQPKAQAQPKQQEKISTAPSVAQEPTELTPDQELNKMVAHGQQFSDDLKYGKIQPRTYHDLFAEKSTLGKMGTIFGLLLGGVGSGLTGQPNAALEMMNKEIERDFSAQKNNQQNKQNWYNASLAYQKQQPEIAAAYAKASQYGSEADMAKFRNMQAGIIDNTASAEAQNSATIGYLHNAQSQIERMAPGPARDMAQTQYDTKVVPFFMDKMLKRAQDAVGKNAVLKAATPAPAHKLNPPPAKGIAEAGKHYDSVNEDRFAKAVQKGKFAPEAPDAIPDGLLNTVNQEKAALEQNRDNLADVDAAFNYLAKIKHTGQAPAAGAIPAFLGTAGGIAGGLFTGPIGGAIAAGVSKMGGDKIASGIKSVFERERNIVIDALKERIGKGLSDEAKLNLINSLLPNWADNEKTMGLAHSNMVNHFKSNPEEKAPNLRRLNLSYPIPNYQFSLPKQKDGGKEGLINAIKEKKESPRSNERPRSRQE